MKTDDTEHEGLKDEIAVCLVYYSGFYKTLVFVQRFAHDVETRRLQMDEKSREKLARVEEREKLIDARKELWREDHNMVRILAFYNQIFLI